MKWSPEDRNEENRFWKHKKCETKKKDAERDKTAFLGSFPDEISNPKVEKEGWKRKAKKPIDESRRSWEAKKSSNNRRPRRSNANGKLMPGTTYQWNEVAKLSFFGRRAKMIRNLTHTKEDATLSWRWKIISKKAYDVTFKASQKPKRRRNAA